MNYLHGFGNHFESEAEKGALPLGQNSPQKPPFGLFPEQLSGTAFTVPRAQNLKTWLYKIKPSAATSSFTEVGHATWLTDDSTGKFIKTPEALRFHPFPLPSQKVDFLTGLHTYVKNGNPGQNSGCAIHMTRFNESMKDLFLYNADGEMMIVLDTGEITIHTEMGRLELSPLYIGVIPRGVKFRVELRSALARAYVCENFGQPFKLPELGPIGANGLANPRDFEIPTAHYEDLKGPFQLFARYQGSLWQTEVSHSPLDTVAWHGNYVPYRYDLRKYNTMNSVSFDHPDPCIFTVLTSGSAHPGTANIDFVIFPPRYMVAEHTFRPPYYHRNVMNEFMGLIEGKYDAKESGFRPGGASLHNAFTGHGPDVEGFLKATSSELTPEKYHSTMAFMWESSSPFSISETIYKDKNLRDQEYLNCWKDLPRLFSQKK